MATFTGKDGVIKINTSTVAQSKSWTIEQSAEPIEASVIGATWRNYKPGLNGFTVSIEGYYDLADVGQDELVIGAEVAVELFPAGEVSGQREYSGNAFITSFSDTGSFDGMVEFTATLQGNGNLTSTVQA